MLLGFLFTVNLIATHLHYYRKRFAVWQVKNAVDIAGQAYWNGKIMNNEYSDTNRHRNLWPALRLAFLIGGVTCLVLACEPVRYYNHIEVAAFGGNFHRKPHGTVNVFQTVDDIKRPYEVIGRMSCEGPAKQEAGILNAMLYHAANIGADGLLLGGLDMAEEQLGNGSNSNAYDIRFRAGFMALIGNGNSDRRIFRAQAIRFKE